MEYRICREMVDDEERARAAGSEEYINEADPSILRFLIASRDVASAQQLRDDLLSMLVAGHETTASVLTWTIYLLCQNPEAMRKVQVHFSVAPGQLSGTFSFYFNLRPE
jgi:carotenoid epsilon hydroxylase